MVPVQAAIEAGANPAALVDAINSRQAEFDVACEELARTPSARAVGRAEIEAWVVMVGEMAVGLDRADPAKLQMFYEAVSLEILHDAEGRTVDVTIRRPVRRPTPNRRIGSPSRSSPPRGLRTVRPC
ncbi:hypothetical protein [Alloactinosynnema sp. L-07]|uniref:hypothetical protein n=1 Tax=Alloactinosynnema sp. L-07 TaxID=1653480 RepID=UPI00065EF57E|nr:hypothetical protein [Alloactinosynnema sp. L-07]CRK56755.1 hypothetical protein [Alloactinosynnema sp. L-07]